MEEILGAVRPFNDAAPSSQQQSRDASFTTGVVLHGPFTYRDGGLAVALKGRPRLDGAPFDEKVVARQVHSRYRDEGARFLRRMRGPFAVAVVEIASRKTLLAIDRMGIETLAWGAGRDGFAFGTSAAAVATHFAARPRLNSQALFDFMFGHMVAAPDSAYAGVTKLAGGTYLEIEGARVAVQRYWEPDFSHAPMGEVPTLRAELQPTIERAIERCDPDEHTGTFLSGGLDSSTVTGLFNASRRGAADAFSVAFGVDEFNELSYARIAARRFGCSHHVYEVVPEDVVDLIPKIAAAYDEPFGNSSAVPTFCCARLAKHHGMDHLLAGDGGDEIFGGNSRYVRHKAFELYSRAPGWLRTAVAEPLAAVLAGAPLQLSKFSSYVRQAKIPLPERFESWNMIYREGAAAVFDREFVDSIDPDYPLRRLRELWQSCPSVDLLDRMLWYDWKLTLADNDLRKVSRMCEMAEIRASYPLLDEDVMSLAIKVPSKAKISGTELRTFFKSAMRGFLPEEIIKKQKHGFGLPFGVWLKGHKPLQELVFDTLSSLKERRILSRSFIDRVTQEYRSGHAAYYGSAIWDMVMLEQWLLSRDSETATLPSRKIATHVQS